MGKAIEGFFHWFLVIFLLLFIVVYCGLLWFIGNVSFYFWKAEFSDGYIHLNTLPSLGGNEDSLGGNELHTLTCTYMHS